MQIEQETNETLAKAAVVDISIDLRIHRDSEKPEWRVEVHSKARERLLRKTLEEVFGAPVRIVDRGMSIEDGNELEVLTVRMEEV